jgi:hypothetical protein
MSGSMAFKMVTAYLNGLPGFLDTAAVYRLPKEKYVYFLRLFGFHISGRGTAIIVRNSGRLRYMAGPPTPANRPTPSTPTFQEPSSSSGIIRSIPRTPTAIPRTPTRIPRTPTAIPRTPTAIPRTPTRIPRTPTTRPPQEPSSSSGNQPVEVPVERTTRVPKHGNITLRQENPFPLHGPGWNKYELYKSATTVKMIKNRGISSFDLGTYWRSGYLTQTEIQPVNLPVKNPYQRGGMRYIRYEIY